MSTQRENERSPMWTAVGQLGGMIPGVRPVAAGVARNTVQRLLGFWVIFHLYGGLRPAIEAGVLTTSTAYRQRGEFERVFGVDVGEFALDVAMPFSKVADRD